MLVLIWTNAVLLSLVCSPGVLKHKTWLGWLTGQVKWLYGARLIEASLIEAYLSFSSCFWVERESSASLFSSLKLEIGICQEISLFLWDHLLLPSPRCTLWMVCFVCLRASNDTFHCIPINVTIINQIKSNSAVCEWFFLWELLFEDTSFSGNCCQNLCPEM